MVGSSYIRTCTVAIPVHKFILEIIIICMLSLQFDDHPAISQHQPHATLSVCPLMELTFSPCMDLHMYTSGWTCMKWTGGVVRGGHTQGGSRNTPLALLTGHYHFNTHTISVRG